MTFQQSYVSSSAATIAATAVSESGIEMEATDGEGGGLQDELMVHVNTLRDAVKEHNSGCFDRCKDEGRPCDCAAISLIGLQDAAADATKAMELNISEVDEFIAGLQVSDEDIEEHSSHVRGEVLGDFAEDIAAICAWGLAAGADLLALRCELPSPIVAEMVRRIDLNTPPGNPLAVFNDALNALGPDQAGIAVDTMRRYIGQLEACPQGSTPYVEEPPYVETVEEEAERLTTPEVPPCPETEAEGEGAKRGASGESPEAPNSVPSLEAFSQTLRDYQQAVVDDAGEFIAECWETAPPRQRIVYASPAGSGKGSIQLAMLKELRAQDVTAWILTPSLEVLRGFLERCGAQLEGVSETKLAELGESIYCTTPVRMRNRTLDGQREMPDIVIYDEVHHAISANDVSGTLFAIAPDAVWIGFTATPYRASPKATAMLRDDWGEPVEVMSIPDAIREGWQALPAFRMAPLVDDDVVKVQGGEFQVKAMTKEYRSRIDALAELVVCELAGDSESRTVKETNDGETYDVELPLSSLPTCVVVPSSDVAGMLVEVLDSKGQDAIWVHQGTKAKDRALAYEACKAGRVVLVSINVLSEGVDFPWLRRLIDAKPTLSPVMWVQTIGRIMRPGGVQPQYVCTNRNLERHAYLMQGAIPRSVIVEAQEAFEKPSKRSGLRQIGLEALRRFKAIPVPLDGGGVGSMYCVYSIAEDGVKTEYVTLCDPGHDKPFVAKRSIQPASGVDAKGHPARDPSAYGKWALCDIPTDFTGYKTTSSAGKLSAKMAGWWERDARRYGLSDREMDKLTRKQFQALPVLANTKRHMHGMSV